MDTIAALGAIVPPVGEFPSLFRWWSIPAASTILRRIGRIDFVELTTGTLSLRLENPTKRVPACIKNALVQPCFSGMAVRQVDSSEFILFGSRRPGHIGDAEFFNGDDTIAIYDFAGFLMVKVMTSVPNPLMNTSDHLLGLATRSGPAPVFDLIELTLGFCKRLLLRSEETRVLNGLCVVREGGEVLKSDIDADRSGGLR